MSEKIRDFLTTIEPFAKIPPQELERLSAIIQIVQHQKNEVIFSEGQEADSVWILQSGRVEIFKYNSEGKPHAIEIVLPKDLFGILCRLGTKKSTYPCTAIASVDSVSYRVQDKYFLELFNRNPQMASGICLLCSERLHDMQKLTGISNEPVELRITKALISLSEKHGYKLPYTKRQIGEFAATTVETTIRTLSIFEKKGYISSSRGQIILKNVDELKAHLN